MPSRAPLESGSDDFAMTSAREFVRANGARQRTSPPRWRRRPPALTVSVDAPGAVRFYHHVGHLPETPPSTASSSPLTAELQAPTSGRSSPPACPARCWRCRWSHETHLAAVGARASPGATLAAAIGGVLLAAAAERSRQSPEKCAGDGGVRAARPKETIALMRLLRATPDTSARTAALIELRVQARLAVLNLPARRPRLRTRLGRSVPGPRSWSRRAPTYSRSVSAAPCRWAAT